MAGKGKPGPNKRNTPRTVPVGLSLYPAQLEWLKKTAAKDTGPFGLPSVSRVIQSLIDQAILSESMSK